MPASQLADRIDMGMKSVVTLAGYHQGLSVQRICRIQYPMRLTWRLPVRKQPSLPQVLRASLAEDRDHVFRAPDVAQG